MRQENRHAISDGHRERDPTLGRDVTIGLTCAKKSLPPAIVREHSRAVNLAPDHDPASLVRQVVLQTRPAHHHFAYRVIAGETKRPCFPRRGECADPETRESIDFL